MKTRDSVARAGRIIGFAACLFTLIAPLPAAASTIRVSDPFEPMNRAFFGLHQMLDHILFRPAAVAYKRILPKPIRSGIAHVFSNLGEPAVFVNDVLQGHPKEATETFTRFAGNTTFGLLGVFDVATHAGLPHHPNDFGITLARYGVKPGPYIFIPFAGPTTVRDAIGSMAGLALNPLIFLRYAADDAVGATSAIGTGLEARVDADDELKALFAGATDPYASFRSYFLQNREAEVNGGRIDIEELPDFGAPDTAPSGGSTSGDQSTAAPVSGATAPSATTAPSSARSAGGEASGSSASSGAGTAVTAGAGPTTAFASLSAAGSAPLAQP